MRAGANNVGFLEKHAPMVAGYGKTRMFTVAMLQLLAEDQRHCDRVKMNYWVDEAEAMRPTPRVNVGYLAAQDPTLLGGRFSRSVLSHVVQGAFRGAINHCSVKVWQECFRMHSPGISL